MEDYIDSADMIEEGKFLPNLPSNHYSLFIESDAETDFETANESSESDFETAHELSEPEFGNDDDCILDDEYGWDEGYISDYDYLNLENTTIMRTSSRDKTMDYQIEGYVQGKKIDMTLDCGAQKSVLSRKFYNSLSKPPKLGKSIKLVGFTDDFSLKGQWTSIKMSSGKFKSSKMKVIVADIDADFLLGKDFFDDHKIVLDIKDQKFQIDEFTVPLKENDSNLSDKNDSIKLATLKTDVKLPPQQAVLVNVAIDSNLDSDSNLCLESIPNSMNIILPACVVTNYPYAWIHLHNYTSNTVILKAGTPVGQVTEAEVLENNTNDCQNDESVTIKTASVDLESQITDPKIKEAVEEMPEHLRDLFLRSTAELSTEESLKVASLVSEFHDVFAKNYLDVGTYNASKFHIDTGDAKPVRLKLRRSPLHFQQQEREQLQDLLDRGIIRESQSPWAAAPVLVQKKTFGQDACTQSHIRYCLDYRELNKVTTVPAYPLPNLTDLMNFLGSSSWFSTLDMANGYYQIKIDEESIPKTAFACAYGLYEFTVMCYGLKGAPAAFQQAMGIVLNGLIGRLCQAYLDDVTVIGTTFDEHLDNLRTVFLRFRQYGMKLKPSKCDLFKKHTEFLGRHISEKGISVNEDQLKVVQHWPRPKNVSELYRFIGFANWLRNFVPYFAELALPLYNLLKKNVPYIWSDAQEQAFLQIREMLVSPPCLAYAKPDGQFHLEVDSSKRACGAMLYQNQLFEGKEQLRLISCFSAVYTPAQTRWCSSRQELLALVRAIREFRVYLLGRKFSVCTDCRVVSFLFSFKDPQGVLARIQEELGSYDFDIKHKKGCLMVCPDALSRIPDQLPYCDQYRAGCKPENLPCHSPDNECKFCQRAYRQWNRFEEEVDYVVPLGLSSTANSRDRLRYFDTEDQLARTVSAPTDQAAPQVDLTKPTEEKIETISIKTLFEDDDTITELPTDLSETLPYGVDPEEEVYTSDDNELDLSNIVRNKPLDPDLDTTLAYGLDIIVDDAVIDPDIMEDEAMTENDPDVEVERTNEHEIWDVEDGYELVDNPTPGIDVYDLELTYTYGGTEYVERVTKDKMVDMQKQDKDIGLVIKWLKEGAPTQNELSGSSKACKMYWLNRNQLIFKDGILYYSWLHRPWCELCLVVPEVLRPFILYHSHAGAGVGHFGRNRLLQRLRRTFFWYGLHNDAVLNVCSIM